MDLELLHSICLAVSQVRTVQTVLKLIVDGLVERAGLALARIWLVGPGDICTTCPMGLECPSQHALPAFGGQRRPLAGGWNGVEGP